nr:hypothetical protein [Rhizobium sp. ACO-34A]
MVKIVCSIWAWQRREFGAESDSPFFPLYRCNQRHPETFKMAPQSAQDIEPNDSLFTLHSVDGARRYARRFRDVSLTEVKGFPCRVKKAVHGLHPPSISGFKTVDNTLVNQTSIGENMIRIGVNMQ